MANGKKKQPETKAPASTTALVKTADLSSYALTQAKDLKEARRIYEANMQGEALDIFSLPRYTVAGGGATAFQRSDGNSVLELRGVILEIIAMRRYYQQGLSEGADPGPPNCSATNSDTGLGDPGVDCFKCAFNVFGSADSGGGKKCKESRAIFLQTPDSLLMPSVVQVPPTSLRNFRGYRADLSNKALPFWHVETIFTLQKAISGKIPYAKIVCALGGKLSAEHLVLIEGERKALLPVIARASGRGDLAAGLSPDSEE